MKLEVSMQLVNLDLGKDSAFCLKNLAGGDSLQPDRDGKGWPGM